MCLATNATSIQIRGVVLCGREISGQRRRYRGTGLKIDEATKNYDCSGTELRTAFGRNVLAKKN